MASGGHPSANRWQPGPASLLSDAVAPTIPGMDGWEIVRRAAADRRSGAAEIAATLSDPTRNATSVPGKSMAAESAMSA